MLFFFLDLLKTCSVEACAVCLAEIEMKSERKQMCESNLVLYKLYTREKCFPEKPKDVDNLLPIGELFTSSSSSLCVCVSVCVLK